MSMRPTIWLLALLAGCGPHQRPAPVVPTSLQLRPGALVRIRQPDGGVILGRLARPFAADSPHITMCPYEREGCDADDSAKFRITSLTAADRVSVWGRASAALFPLGLYSGALVGALVDGSGRNPNVGGMALGMLGGAVVGALVGSRVSSWVPLVPCGGEICGWGAAEYPTRAAAR